MSGESHRDAWEDWGAVDPLYAILTDPRYRHGGGDPAEFLAGGQGTVQMVLGEAARAGVVPRRDAALDFGCGIGRLTWALGEQFQSVVGLDVAASMVRRARQLHATRERCAFAQHHGSDLRQYPDATFDCVLCLLVLQHLGSEHAIVTYLREFVRVLRPGGLLAFQLPSKVPAPPSPPPLNTAEGLRRRAGPLLRRVGVGAGVLYRRLDWVPEMTMTAVPEEQTVDVLRGAGATVVHASEPETDRGGTVSRLYYVTRPR